MSAIHDKLVHAAIDTFARYGFRRATMGDIATAAGVSRPTLYARFANKDELLSAAIKTVGAQALSELDTQWRTLNRIDDVLRVYCAQVTVKQYDMIKNTPDAAELLSNLTGNGADALMTVQADYATALSARIIATTPQPKDQADRIARYFVDAAKGLKTIARDKDTLIDQLDLLVTTTVAQIDASPPGQPDTPLGQSMA